MTNIRSKIAVGVVGLTLALTAAAQDVPKDEAVLLVTLAYAGERWEAGDARILPCGAPSKPSVGSRQASVVTTKDRSGKVLFSKRMHNPRMILVEDPKEPIELLKETKFVLRVPYSEGMAQFEFYEHGREQSKPSVAVDLQGAAKTFFDRGGYAQYAPCQITALPVLPDFDRDNDRDRAELPLELVVQLIKADPKSAARVALEMGVTPDDLGALVDENRSQIDRAGVSERELEELLDLFSRIYQGG